MHDRVGTPVGLNRYAELGFDVPEVPPGEGIPVFPHALVPFHELIVRLTLPGKTKTGIFDRNFEDPARYRPTDPDVPTGRPYLIQGFDPGVEYRGMAPREAVTMLADRRPATIEEGLAAFIHDPTVLQRNACFSLAGSTRGDKRVPALWISQGAPKLGWCFAGAPHSWLGLASVQTRIYGPA